jgi:acetyl-CoA synthetase
MFEGVPSYPDFGRFWQVSGQAQGRHLLHRTHRPAGADARRRRLGDERTSRKPASELLGSVGEPINLGGMGMVSTSVVGEGPLPESSTPGGRPRPAAIMITPLPGATPLKPGSATRPFFGVQPVILDEQGEEIEGNPATGNLAIKYPWPGHDAHRVTATIERFVPDLLFDCILGTLLHRRRRSP